MEIDTIPLESINAAPYNPRKDLQPGDREYDELERSLAKWDTVEPLVWNRRSGNLVSGHQRLKILRARGDTTAVVSVVELDREDEMALNIALNKTGGTWDDRKLFEALSELDTGSPDLLPLTGFDHEALGRLAGDLNVRMFEPTTPDEISAAAVTEADMSGAQTQIDKKFTRRKAMEEVMCPECGHAFAVPKLVGGRAVTEDAPAASAEEDA